VTIDHDRAIRNARYLAKKSAQIEAAGKRAGLHRISVVHDNDEGCCRREPWETTFARLFAPLVAAAAGRDPADVAALLAEHEPGAIVVGPMRR
jgi:hypothetical protein